MAHNSVFDENVLHTTSSKVPLILKTQCSWGRYKTCWSHTVSLLDKWIICLLYGQISCNPVLIIVHDSVEH